MVKLSRIQVWNHNLCVQMINIEYMWCLMLPPKATSVIQRLDVEIIAMVKG